MQHQRKYACDKHAYVDAAEKCRKINQFILFSSGFKVHNTILQRQLLFRFRLRGLHADIVR